LNSAIDVLTAIVI